LVHQRYAHCAWETDSGIILLGGSESPTSTELLKEDGGSEELFPLKYPSSYSCGIGDITTTSITITGGSDDGPSNKVSQYNIEGWVRDLPQLQEGRYSHGCGHYVNNDNDMAS